jgi:cell division protein FtsB
MANKEEDLTGLLEYSLQISFAKLTEVIKNKSEAIKQLNEQIEELQQSIKELKVNKDTLESTVADCQDQCQRANVEFGFKFS